MYLNYINFHMIHYFFGLTYISFIVCIYIYIVHYYYYLYTYIYMTYIYTYDDPYLIFVFHIDSWKPWPRVDKHDDILRKKKCDVP